MWAENTESGKIKFVERYTNPLTLKSQRVSVTLDKDTARNRRLALQMLNEKIDKKLYEDSGSRNNKFTLADLAKAYLQFQKSSLKASSSQRTSVMCKFFLEVLGRDIRLNQLTASYVRRKLAIRNSNTQVTASTQNERLIRFKAMMRWGYENDFIDDIRFLDKLKPLPDFSRADKLSNKFLESDELRRLLQSMKIEQWELLTEFLALSGLRIGEAIALNYNDVNEDTRIIAVDKTFYTFNRTVNTPKTATSNREVYMQDELLPVCRKIKQYTLTDSKRYDYRINLLFCDIYGDYIHYDAYRQYLGDCAEKCLGRRITPHVLRHTHTSLLAAAGVPLETISRRLGHEDSAITKRIYFHVTEGLKEADQNYIKKVEIL